METKYIILLILFGIDLAICVINVIINKKARDGYIMAIVGFICGILLTIKLAYNG